MSPCISFIQKHVPQKFNSLQYEKIPFILGIRTISSIQTHVPQNYFSTNRRYTSPERKSLKMNGTIQNCTRHSDTVTHSEVTTHTGVAILMWPHITLCIIDAVANGLWLVSPKNDDATVDWHRRSYTIPAYEPKGQTWDIALSSRGIGTFCVLHTLVWGLAVLLGLTSGLHHPNSAFFYTGIFTGLTPSCHANSGKCKVIWKLHVYWNVHHCNSWRMKNQLDVTCYFISLIMRSTCFGH